MDSSQRVKILRNKWFDLRDRYHQFRIWGLKFDNGTIAFILCDAEGNGPGHLEIQKGDNHED